MRYVEVGGQTIGIRSNDTCLGKIFRKSIDGNPLCHYNPYFHLWICHDRLLKNETRLSKTSIRFWYFELDDDRYLVIVKVREGSKTKAVYLDNGFVLLNI